MSFQAPFPAKPADDLFQLWQQVQRALNTLEGKEYVAEKWLQDHHWYQLDKQDSDWVDLMTAVERVAPARSSRLLAARYHWAKTKGQDQLSAPVLLEHSHHCWNVACSALRASNESDQLPCGCGADQLQAINGQQIEGGCCGD